MKIGPYPNLKDWLYAKRAQKLRKKGLIGRGHNNVIPTNVWWLELCLAFRQLQCSILNMFRWNLDENGTPKFVGKTFPIGRLYAKKIKKDGTVEDIGLLGTKYVTTVFVNDMVDSLHSAALINDYKYHASGTTNTAENASDTALGTEVEASRATGTQTEGASANIYKSVATITYTATRSIVEHGIFDAASVGNLMDRTVFASVGVDNGESIEFTYELTINAGN